MNLKSLDGEALIVTTKRLVGEERLKTLQVIEHLQEIYDRRLHLARGFRSLHEFLVRELGYDDGQAHRRISAMRLVQSLPEAKISIAEGRLTLTNAAQLQDFFKAAPERNKLEVLRSVEGTTKRECGRKLNAIEPSFGKKGDDELDALLKEFRQLSQISNDQEAIKQALKLAIGKLKTSPEASPAKPRGIPRQKLKLSDPDSRYVSRVLERQVWAKSQGRCAFEFEDRRCTATQHLEVDHIDPWAYGGDTSLENLRLLCRAHNRYLGSKLVANATVVRSEPVL